MAGEDTESVTVAGDVMGDQRSYQRLYGGARYNMQHNTRIKYKENYYFMEHSSHKPEK